MSCIWRPSQAPQTQMNEPIHTLTFSRFTIRLHYIISEPFSTSDSICNSRGNDAIISLPTISSSDSHALQFASVGSDSGSDLLDWSSQGYNLCFNSYYFQSDICVFLKLES